MVSVIIPVYNAEKYIEKCVTSVLNQKFQDFEIILVDDGSVDNSLFLCKEFENEDARVKCIHQSNKGLSASRNAGLHIAEGEYIIFLDADDWIEDDMLMTYYTDICNSNADVVIQGFKIEFEKTGQTIQNTVNNDEIYSGETLWQGVYTLEKYGLLNSSCNKMYKTSVIKKNGLEFQWDAMPAEDLIFNCEYFKHISCIYISKNAHYHYIKRENITMTNLYREGYEEQIIKYNIAREKLYETIDLPKDKSEELLLNSLSTYALTAISNIYNSVDILSSKQKMNKLKSLLSDNKINYALLNSPYVNVFISIIRIIIKINNIKFCHIILLFLFMCKRKFSGLYRIVRTRILYGGK